MGSIRPSGHKSFTDSLQSLSQSGKCNIVPSISHKIKGFKPFVSLTSLKDESIEIVDFIHTKEYSDSVNAYGAAAQEINKLGEWTDWYRNAVNEKGESVGSHEVKNLKLSVIDNTGGKQ